MGWHRYSRASPPGKCRLTPHWKLAPTVINPLPRNYLAATERYASQVQIVEPPDGGLTLRNYLGGIPFPNPHAFSRAMTKRMKNAEPNRAPSQ